MVYYRKYRPQIIADLDNGSVRLSLTSLFSKKDIVHALLFTGTRGLGKTSAARIVAKVINCEKRGKETEPCNLCESCMSITNGTNVDILEIDAASNRGIDEIRSLRETIKLASSARGKKVYIIDEVHMLTTEAFNALLKMLEEPPSHVVFILCTTELYKIPKTIQSRCFHIAFATATEEELLHSLKRIVAGEKLLVDENVLSLIAKRADGSFRDGAKLLEQVALLSDKQITIDMVSSLLQTQESTAEFLLAFEKKDIQTSLNILHTTLEKGMPPKVFVEDILQKLHHALLQKYTLEKAESQLTSFSTAKLAEMISIFIKATHMMKNSPIPQLPIELGIIEYGEQRKGGDLV